jgi:hypothetical protein
MQKALFFYYSNMSDVDEHKQKKYCDMPEQTRKERESKRKIGTN